MIPTVQFDPPRAKGMSLRDYVALQFAASWLGTYSPDSSHPAKRENAGALERVCTDAYKLADAFILHSQLNKDQYNPKTSSKLWIAEFSTGETDAECSYHVFLGSEQEAQLEAEEVARARGIGYVWIKTETKLEDL